MKQMLRIKSFIFGTALLLGVSLTQTMQVPPQNYHSAGVVPYAEDSSHVLYVLIGLEPLRQNLAFDFGGKKDPEDKDHSAFTAAREGAEELLFIFDDNPSFEKILEYKQKHKSGFNLYRTSATTYWSVLKTIKQQPTGSLYQGYQTYFIKINYDPTLPTLFSARKKQYSGKLPHAWNEKGHLYWVKLTDLIAALTQSKNLDQVFVPVTQGAIKVRLFPPFAASLKSALDNGVLQSLK
jgi:hypothetical protein